MRIRVEGEESLPEDKGRSQEEEPPRQEEAPPAPQEDRVTLQKQEVPEEEEGEEAVEVSIETLQQALAQKSQEAEGLYRQLLRTQADFENYKKRAERDRGEYTRYAIQELIVSLLPVIDNLERAIKAAEGGADREALLDGVRMTFEQLMGVLREAGVSQIPTEGLPFDPTIHEAIATVPAEGTNPDQDMVAEEVLKGYRMHDRVIRPSKVVVVKARNGGASG